MGRRMAEGAALLVDHVLPPVVLKDRSGEALRDRGEELAGGAAG